MLHNNQSGLVAGPRLHYDTSEEKFTLYPPDIKAFLYYSTLPGRPLISGELRLRVTSRDDPTSFESGYDLLSLNGQPWSRPLFMLSGCSSYNPLYKRLRKDGLVPNDLHAIISTFPSSSNIYYRGQQLYTLNDTFMVDFSKENLQFTVITEQGLEGLQLTRPFYDKRGQIPMKPYTGAYKQIAIWIDDSNETVGSALARFERSTLPEHKGTRTVVLRFLQIITPLKCVIPLYDGYVGLPKEGELHRRSKRINNGRSVDKLNLPVWSVNVDTGTSFNNSPPRRITYKRIRALQFLWDT